MDKKVLKGKNFMAGEKPVPGGKRRRTGINTDDRDKEASAGRFS